MLGPAFNNETEEASFARTCYGVRGVGEVPIVPPMAAVANAIADATGRRLRDLPMSPPKLLSAFAENDPEPQRLAAE